MLKIFLSHQTHLFGLLPKKKTKKQKKVEKTKSTVARAIVSIYIVSR